MTDTAIINPAINSELSANLTSLEQKIYETAQHNLDQIDGGQFTAIEKQAILHTEALHLTGALDLTTLLIRGKIVKEIVEKNLTTQHPSEYTSLRELASDQGLSHSELSRTLTCVDVVFPYLRDTLNVNIAEMWDRVGKSKMFEMLPHFTAMITGEESPSDRVNESVEMLREEVIATAVAMGRDLDDAQVNQTVIGQLLDDASQLPVREMRSRMNPDPTPPIQTTYINSEGETFLLAALTHDQVEKFERLMASHSDAQVFDLPSDPTIRAHEAAGIPMVARITNLVSTN